MMTTGAHPAAWYWRFTFLIIGSATYEEETGRASSEQVAGGGARIYDCQLVGGGERACVRRLLLTLSTTYVVNRNNN